MNERLSETELSTWRSVMAAKTRLLERLDHELQQRSSLSLTDYEILTVLSESPRKRIRMSELADRVLVSRSRLTYRIDRLTQLGYVNREECADDRRGLYAILSDNGSATLEAATPHHTRDLRTWFFDSLDPGELETLNTIMTRIDGKLSVN